MAQLAVGDASVADEAGWNWGDDEPFREDGGGPATDRLRDILVAVAFRSGQRDIEIAGLACGRVSGARRHFNISATQKTGLGE
jgi:hypothetical protein